LSFPFLSLIIFLPLVAGLLILFLPARAVRAPRVVALVASVLAFALTIWVFTHYDLQAAGYQFQEYVPWLPALGIGYHVGIDGISLPLLLLGSLILLGGVLVSWHIEERTREYFSFFMFLGTSVLGVFSSLDLFQLIFFYELAVFPKYLMILIWGYPQTREYGAMKLTLYIFVGSMVALVGILAVYFGSGMGTFDLVELEKASFAPAFQRIWFPVIFFGFAVLAGIFPFHSWAPDGHVAAPTAVSMRLAGVEMKVGAFAALRAGIMLLPVGAQTWAPLILGLGTVNVIYGALIAMVQRDLKYVIGFSSVSHMGLVLIGFATLNADGLLGATLQMFSHGVMTGLFFAVVGMIYDRTHTREIARLGGLAEKMRWPVVGFILAGLVSMGMPLFSGFVAEVPIYMGVWQRAPVVGIVAIFSVLITAAYIFMVTRQVFFGNLPADFSGVGEVTLPDKVVVGLLAATVVLMGIFPGWIVPLAQSGVTHVLAVLGG
jgi:NADH-quinone oxidoreductase subunit M